MAGTGAEDNDIACGVQVVAHPVTQLSLHPSGAKNTLEPAVLRQACQPQNLSNEAIARFSLPREQTASTARFRLSTSVPSGEQIPVVAVAKLDFAQKGPSTAL